VRPTYEGKVLMTEDEEREALELNLPLDQYQVVGTHNRFLESIDSSD
jgi:hypothetical protein